MSGPPAPPEMLVCLAMSSLLVNYLLGASHSVLVVTAMTEYYVGGGQLAVSDQPANTAQLVNIGKDILCSFEV
jgi:hypothetical protein